MVNYYTVTPCNVRSSQQAKYWIFLTFALHRSRWGQKDIPDSKSFIGDELFRAFEKAKKMSPLLESFWILVERFWDWRTGWWASAISSSLSSNR